MKSGILRHCAVAVILASTPWAAPSFGQDIAPSITAGTKPVIDKADARATVTIDAVSVVQSGTLVDIRLDESVSSKTHQKGDWFALSLSEPVMLGDSIIVPAGTPGRGQVVHSAKAGWGGKGGELILVARYLDFDGRRIGLRGMKLGARGKDNDNLAMATTMAIGPVGMLINGKNAALEKGTPASAKLAEDLSSPTKIESGDGADSVLPDPAVRIENGPSTGAENREGVEE